LCVVYISYYKEGRYLMAAGAGISCFPPAEIISIVSDSNVRY